MQLPSRTLLALAVEADAAPNTVRRRLAGQPVRPALAARIEAAAKQLGVKLPRSKAPAPRLRRPAHHPTPKGRG